MPDFRDGSLSSFPGSLDDFPILRPFDESLPLASQLEHALEQADHFNLYFDAIYNIEVDQINKIGGPLTGFYPKDQSLENYKVTSSDLPLSYLQLTGTLTTAATSIAMTGVVPSQFGSDPFGDGNFSIMMTTYVSALGTVDLKGIGAGDYGAPESNVWNRSMALPNIITMLHPTGGSNFTVTVTDTGMNPNGTGVTETSMFDNLEQPNDTVLHNNPEWDYIDGTVVRTLGARYITQGTTQYLRLCSEGGPNNHQSGAWYPTGIPESSDVTIEFYGPIYSKWKFAKDSGEVYNRVGPYGRFTGTATNCSFYALVIGDWAENDATLSSLGLPNDQAARLVKVEGFDFSPVSGSDGDGAFTWPNWDSASTVTELSSVRLDLSTTGPFRFVISGNTIDVQEWTGSWTSMLGSGAVTDGSPLSGPGKFGFFAGGLDDGNFRYTHIPGPLTLTATDSNITDAEVAVELTFVKIGDAANNSYRSV